MVLEVKRLQELATVPTKATAESAGYDIYAANRQPLRVRAGQSELVPTGLAVAIPQGMVGLLCGRSGLGVRYGISLSNAVGVIDSDFRGELQVGLRNSSQMDYTVHTGDRIAQLLLLPIALLPIAEVTELTQTVRGVGGFGSTGR